MARFQLTTGMLSELQEIHHRLDTLTNGLSIAFNIILLYLIKKHSTYGVQAYQFLLAIDAALDLVIGVVVLEAQPVRLAPSENLTVKGFNFRAILLSEQPKPTA